MMEKCVALAAPVNDVAHGSCEGTRRPSLPVHRTEQSCVLARPRITHEFPFVVEHFGQRFMGPCTRLVLNEPAEAMRALGQHHQCDSPAERMADDVRAHKADRVEPVRHGAGVPIELIRCVGPGRKTVAWAVVHEDKPIARETWSDTTPCTVAVVQAVHEHERGLGRPLTQLSPMQPDTVDVGMMMTPRGRLRPALDRERRAADGSATSCDRLHTRAISAFLAPLCRALLAANQLGDAQSRPTSPSSSTVHGFSKP
jgi:hypothetical protein